MNTIHKDKIKILSGVITLFFLLTVTLNTASSTTAKPSVHVLCYHAFLNKKNKFCFSEDELRSHVEYLKRNGYRFVSVYDVLMDNIRGKKNILFTIDDGNKSVYSAYYNVLRPNNIRPLLGIYTGIIGKKKYALTWKQLKRLSLDGCDIASHGHYHRKMNRRLFKKEKRAFIREIYHSKKLLEKNLGKEIDLFIYPYGIRSGETILSLKKAGYSHAFTIDSGGITIPVSGISNIYELPRYMLLRGNWKTCMNRIDRNRLYRAPERVALFKENKAGKEDKYTIKKREKSKQIKAADSRTGALAMIRKSGSEFIADIRKRLNRKEREKKIYAREVDIRDTGKKTDVKRENLSAYNADTINEKKRKINIDPVRRVFDGMKRDLVAYDYPGNMKREILVKREHDQSQLPHTMERLKVFALNKDADSDKKEENISDSDDGFNHNEEERILEGKLSGNVGKKYNKIKGDYNAISKRSYRSYKRFVDRVKGRVIRIKKKIRAFLIRGLD